MEKPCPGKTTLLGKYSNLILNIIVLVNSYFFHHLWFCGVCAFARDQVSVNNSHCSEAESGSEPRNQSRNWEHQATESFLTKTMPGVLRPICVPPLYRTSSESHANGNYNARGKEPGAPKHTRYSSCPGTLSLPTKTIFTSRARKRIRCCFQHCLCGPHLVWRAGTEPGPGPCVQLGPIKIPGLSTLDNNG